MIESDHPRGDTAGIGAAPISPADIRRAAMNLLSRREHSLAELRQKLRRHFDDEGMLDTQLQRLAAENLQSDERYAASLSRQRAHRGYGPCRLQQELREKGLSEAAIARAFEAAELDWWALAEVAFRKKFGEPARVDLKERVRRSRFMQYRGFTADHYQHLIDV